MISNSDSLAKATKQLMLKEPFYGLFLIMLNKMWREDLDTAGVSKNGINLQLAINPVFWEALSLEYKIGVLKHELLHIAFQHLSLRDKYTHKKLFNIAADLEINQYIDRAYLPGGNYPSKELYEKDTEIFLTSIKSKLEAGELTPKEARNELLRVPMRSIFLEDFAHLKLDAKAGTDYYYKKLSETMDENGNSSDDFVNQLLGNGNGEDDRQAPWEHITWDEFEKLGDAEKKLIQKQLEYQLKEVANQVQKSRGNVPGELRSYIDALFHEEPAKFDWKGYLRRFAGGSLKTFTKKTRRKPSRRFEGSPGLRIKQKKHILVGVDTSSSVSDEELKEVFIEIHHMYKTGADITIVQCDTAISHVGLYSKPQDGKIKIHGRGGTDFQPVIDYYNEHQKKFSCLIFLTDGEAPAPSPKARRRMLWVLTSKSNMTDHLPGPIIKLN